MKETLNVLVVDDDRRMVKTICDILTVKGCEAVPAYSGEEALAAIRAAVPDCVLMDIKMPGIDGVEAVKTIKDLAPDLPVILMSAYATERQAEEAKAQGAYAVLTKPLDLEAVLTFLSLLRKEQSILVVDDDPAFCRTLADILRGRGYSVETETDPVNVLRHFERRYQLVVVLDLKLGATNGIDVMQSIRAKYPTKPVILVTGAREDMAWAVEQGIRSGAYTCIYKPLETTMLFEAIRDISRSKLRNALGTRETGAVRATE